MYRIMTYNLCIVPIVNYLTPLTGMYDLQGLGFVTIYHCIPIAWNIVKFDYMSNSEGLLSMKFPLRTQATIYM